MGSKLWFIIPILLVCSLPGFAQSGASGNVAVNIKGFDFDWGTSDDLDPDTPDTPWVRLVISGAMSGGYTSDYDYESDQYTAQLEVGKKYGMSVQSWDVGNFILQAVPPPGYTMEIQQFPREQFVVDSLTTVFLRVIPNFSEYNGRAGTATALVGGDIQWQASLGILANGSSAGSIAIREPSASSVPLTTLFSAAGLFYEHTSSEVEVVYNPVGVSSPFVANTIRQVIAPQVCADIVVTTSAQAEIKFYHRAQLNASPDSGVRQFSGDPFAWYLFNPGTPENNKITIRSDLRDIADDDLLTTSGSSVDQQKYTVLTRTGTSPDYTWVADEWYFQGGTSQSRVTTVRNGLSETTSVAKPSGSAVFDSERTYELKAWGDEIVSHRVGSVSTDEAVPEFHASTTIAYYDSNSNLGSYARVKSRVTNGGAWEAFEYYDSASGLSDDTGLLKKRYRPFADSTTALPDPISSDAAGEVTEFTYSPDAFGRNRRPASHVTKVGGNIVSSSTTTYSETDSNFFPTTAPDPEHDLYIVTATRLDKDGATPSSGLETVTKYFREDAGVDPLFDTDDFFRMQTHSIALPNGTKQSFVYQRGTWGGSSFSKSANDGLDVEPASRISIITGTIGSGEDYSAHDGYNIDDVKLVSGKSTMSVVIRDDYARIVRIENYVYLSDGNSNNSVALVDWHVTDRESFKYTNAHQIKERSDLRGSVETVSWTGERIDSIAQSDGITINYEEYDDAGRVKEIVRAAQGEISALKTTFDYDAMGHLLEQKIEAPGEHIQTLWGYDDAGRLDSYSEPGQSASTIVHSPESRSRTVSLANGGGVTTILNPDGSTASVEGDAVVNRYYDYEYDVAESQRKVTVEFGSDGSDRQEITWFDRLGRNSKTQRPGFSVTSQADYSETYSYGSSSGLLQKIQRNGGSPSLAPIAFSYDEFGRQIAQGIDFNSNGLDPNSSDRIQGTELIYRNDGPHSSTDLWLYFRSYGYAKETGTLTDISNFSETYSRVSGFSVTGDLRSESYEYDAAGREYHSTVEVEEVTQGATTEITTVVKQTAGGLNQSIAKYQNGFMIENSGPDGLVYKRKYDDLGRPHESIDPWHTGAEATRYAYELNTPWVETIKNANSKTVATYGYDDAGRRISSKDEIGKFTRTSYTARNEVHRQWGDGTYPVEHDYNLWGQRDLLSTYRSAPATDSPTWPTVGTADTTTWKYDEPSGLLEYKQTADTKQTKFTYDGAGLLKTRQWARHLDPTNPSSAYVTSTYNYTSAGDLHTITYNDTAASTPTVPVTYTYDRLGQIKTVNDAVGNRTYGYNSNVPTQLDTELFGGFYSSRIITRQYETGSAVGRYQGFQLGNTTTADADLQQTLSTGLTGRVDNVLSARKYSSTNASRTFKYDYKADTPWVETLSIDGGSPAFAMSRTYDNLGRVEQIKNTWATTERTVFDYEYNSLNQRKNVVQGGTDFDYATDYGDDTFQVYAYDERAQLTQATGYLGGDPASQNVALKNRAFVYGYDSIGNRTTSNRVGYDANDPESNSADAQFQESYQSNQLNQYDSKENKHIFLHGTADFDAKILVEGSSALADREGNYWSDSITVANTSSPWAGTIDVHAAKPEEDTDGPDLILTGTRAARIAPRTQEFEYDLDGNLLNDELYKYTWDAENRLIRIETDPVAATAGYPNYLILFKYDYLGRRVEKTTSLDGTITAAKRFIYDGWNLIAELDATGVSVKRSFTWGLDIADSLTATGGVGALLQIHDNDDSKTLLPTYDANGNVASLINDSGSGAVEAVYEYSPFGELLRADGYYAQKNPFRFSTKYADHETGLIYYGYRYYSPSLGRFINRDPIAEFGGLNLYGFVGNDAINGIDYLGMMGWWESLFGDSGLFGGGIHIGWTIGSDGGVYGPVITDSRTISHPARDGGRRSHARPDGTVADNQTALDRSRSSTDVRSIVQQRELTGQVLVAVLGYPGMVWEELRTTPMTEAEARRVLIVLGSHVPEDHQIFAAKLAILKHYDPEQFKSVKGTIAGGMLVAIWVEQIIGSVGPKSRGPIRVAATKTPLSVGGRGLLKVSEKDLKAAGFQGHHIISDKNPLTMSHELLELADFDLQSKANKIFLPSRADVYPTRTLHNGGHLKRVSQNLGDQMDAVVEAGRLEGWSQQQYRNAILAILREERGLLRSGERALNSVVRPPLK